MCSAIKQVASGRFGVTAEYLANSKMMQIKIAKARSRRRRSVAGTQSRHGNSERAPFRRGGGFISPPPHHDIYSIEDIAQLIYDLKCANPKGQVSVKLVSRFGVGTRRRRCRQSQVDHITIADTTAAPAPAPYHPSNAPERLGNLACRKHTKLWF